VAKTWRDAGAYWLQDPMPVLQGWAPKDYLQCIEMYDDVLDSNWPDLIGIGSVCRRKIKGQDGLLAILKEVTAALPQHVGFHLFGVKSGALSLFGPRVTSTDSAAWQFRARMIALENKRPCTIELKTESMNHWYKKQMSSQE
jgi:hypothetical protein